MIFVSLYDILLALGYCLIAISPILLMYLLGWIFKKLSSIFVKPVKPGELFVSGDPRNPSVAYMLRDYRRGMVKRGR